MDNGDLRPLRMSLTNIWPALLGEKTIFSIFFDFFTDAFTNH